MKTIILLAVAMVLAGCAALPSTIKPAYVSQLNYDTLTREQLEQEQRRIVDALTTAGKRQLSARSKDTVGMIFLWVPLASVSGEDATAEIARLKGELNALQKSAQNRFPDFVAAKDPTIAMSDA